MLLEEDRKQLLEKGMTEEQLNEQLQLFKDGFPFPKLYATASVGNGILTIDNASLTKYRKSWIAYCVNHKVVKFVPASGAASRMFKDLFAFLNSENAAPTSDFEKTFFKNICKFAFYDDLDEACRELYSQSISELCAVGAYKKVVSALLLPEGLDYGRLPKGLLKFHKENNEVRTPIEEHLVEGASYARCNGNKVFLHLTVSPEHQSLFEQLVTKRSLSYAAHFDVDYSISFSQQKSYTDTVAVTPDNEPFRTADGKLLFRPGGHGSLIENLNELDGDVVFIKNIDNVVPDALKAPTVQEKQFLGGLLIHLQEQTFAYLNKLDAGDCTPEEIQEMLTFISDVFCCRIIGNGNSESSDKDVLEFVKKKLNRPIRVCAMVKNTGEPGGGPFWTFSNDNSVQLQILESSQIDMDNAEAKNLFVNGTHFNPADLACSLKDYKGNAFDLTKYVDKSTGFISHKSKDGRELKALEHPGLWNGAMSDWNTVFVEVSSDTFNPVKTVNDLLRPQHQAD